MTKPRRKKASRPHWTEADARRLLDELERSGMGLWRFARELRIVPQRLAWWRKRLRDRTQASTAIVLAPATIMEPRGGGLVVRLPNAVGIELGDASPAWVASLIGALLEST